MAKWKLARSGGKSYTIKQYSIREFVARRNDAFTRDGGTKLGQVTSLEDAVALIRVDSGSKQVDLLDG